MTTNQKGSEGEVSFVLETGKVTLDTEYNLKTMKRLFSTPQAEKQSCLRTT